jgi:hypothetical protein
LTFLVRTVNETEYSLFSREAYDVFKANPTVGRARPLVIEPMQIAKRNLYPGMTLRYDGTEVIPVLRGGGDVAGTKIRCLSVFECLRT